MTYTYALDEQAAPTLAEAKAIVGGKAANLGEMMRSLRLPVPPGFVITAAACREFLASGWPAGLDDELRDRVAALGASAGRGFGDASDPLLVSVRSGAPVSMPGMMDTILDLGLNDATTDGLARLAGAEFARDCRARFEASFASIVGVDDAPTDPWVQLRLAIEAVFRSWDSDRAKAYRREEGIADELGTAVTVQAMVFGNRGRDSATGVVFTRNPATGEPTLYGDILFDAQGEDVVAGTHRTEPIAVLDERLPAVAAELREHATRLERHLADLCDIEFTIEEGRLWLLQVRVGKRSPQAALRIAVDMAEDASFPLSKAEAVERVLPLLAEPPTVATSRTNVVLPLATGLPASPGVASGPIALTPEAAADAADAGQTPILVRAATSPDDVLGMARAAGILTSRGGLASHAAVVARGWGIPAVVGAAALKFGHGTVAVGDTILRADDVITIDGSSGEVFAGAIPGTTEVVPQARTLRGWAEELGITVGEDRADPGDASDVPRTAPAASTPGSPARPSADSASPGSASPDDCLRVLAIKGFATLDALAEAVLSPADVVRPIVDQLEIDGLATTAAGAYRLTDAGTARATTLAQAERDAWGVDSASAALDAFHELDVRMKDTVTAWQLRNPDAQVINDHTDPDYDRGVLERLATLHAETVAWLEPHGPAVPRLASYAVRLGRALEQAEAGEQRYVASPRVDSYHGIWFELHEDLIRLAGRTREDEAAAGRA